MRIALSILFLIGLMTSSCGEPRKERIMRIVQAKLEAEKERLDRNCKAEIIAQANADVDSVIILRALSDTTEIYIKPIKPDVPNLEIPDIDTLGIKPLFLPVKDSLIQSKESI